MGGSGSPETRVGDVPARADTPTQVARTASDQAALRRVAMLVSRGAAPTEIFAAVAREVGTLLGADVVHLARYEHHGIAVALGGWAREGGETLPVGSSTPYSGRNVSGDVLRSGRPVRIDDYATAFGSAAERVRSLGLRAAVGAPIVFEERVWGVVVASSREGPLPPGAEERIAGFTDLVVTALENAETPEQPRPLTHEPAALERVATLVARDVPAGDLFAAVAAEAGTLAGADLSAVVRYDDGEVAGLAVWSPTATRPEPGWRRPLADGDLLWEIRRRRSPWQTRAAAACPIVVDGEVWGAVAVRGAVALPGDSASRLTGFAELVAAAVANARARAQARRLAEEQAGLRRVATLVARERSAEEVFDAIAQEMRVLLGVEDVRLGRFDGDELEVVATSGSNMRVTPIGTRVPLTTGVSARVRQTGQPQRIDGDEVDATAVADARGWGYKTIVAVPLPVQDRLWGVLIAGAREAPFERGVEARLVEFAELMSVAVANLQARDELAASRARIVKAADDERRRVVRDLHDGAQQRLVHAIVTLKLARGAGDLEAARELVREALEHAGGAMAEMRDLVHGIMPAVLARGGLRAAVEALAERAPLPVDVAVDVGRLPPAVEATAYFLVAEALTNVAKHANARRASVDARTDDAAMRVEIRDDGVGGATATGSGLIGLADRVAAFSGTLEIDSPRGGGTRVVASIPLP